MDYIVHDNFRGRTKGVPCIPWLSRSQLFIIAQVSWMSLTAPRNDLKVPLFQRWGWPRRHFPAIWATFWWIKEVKGTCRGAKLRQKWWRCLQKVVCFIPFCHMLKSKRLNFLGCIFMYIYSTSKLPIPESQKKSHVLVITFSVQGLSFFAFFVGQYPHSRNKNSIKTAFRDVPFMWLFILYYIVVFV